MTARTTERPSAILRREVTLQSPVEITDGAGGFSVSWSDVATVWADVRPLSGSEQWMARKLQSAITHRVTLRYRAGVTARMRILYGTRVFNIRTVINIDEANEFLELLAEEGVGI